MSSQIHAKMKKGASMNALSIVLVLCGAVAFALYNIACKASQKGDWKDRSAMTAAVSAAGAAVVLLSYSLVTGGPRLSPHWWIPVITTGVLNIGIMFAKVRARALEDVSLVAPIDSTTPAVVIVVAMIILGEYPTRLGWVGIWVLVIGTYILNIQEVRQQLAARNSTDGAWWWRELRVWLAPFLALRRSAGVRWAFFAVALSTISLNYDGLTARRTDVGFGFGLVYTIVAIGNFIFAMIRREHRGIAMVSALKRVAGVGTPLAVGTILTGLAFKLSLVAYVGTMKRMVIPLTIVLAFFLLKERLAFRQRIVGGVIMAVGAAMIALGG